MNAYACPSCKNKSRFYLIDQNPVSVRLNPQTGELIEYVTEEDLLQQPYRGEMRRIQCAVCGVTDNEGLFAKTAERLK